VQAPDHEVARDTQYNDTQQSSTQHSRLNCDTRNIFWYNSDVAILSEGECHYTEQSYTDCHYVEYSNADCHRDDCSYAECHYF
jgi:hypothetical protein